ncbi:hypothetical protein CRE_17824 [Caenorhabditis remanei]|uniref:F-box domain-containing protein n=1 Tax=Caenorhabditis remanei TaxID=31234 RepID=E3MDJ3_CAERE|nr:hypothetical protein CRE_17824 [Caenorhabditis remanei]
MKPLPYLTWPSILEHMDPLVRLQLVRSSQDMKTAEKRLPIRIDYLHLDRNCININGIKYEFLVTNYTLSIHSANGDLLKRERVRGGMSRREAIQYLYRKLFGRNPVAVNVKNLVIDVDTSRRDIYWPIDLKLNVYNLKVTKMSGRDIVNPKKNRGLSVGMEDHDMPSAGYGAWNLTNFFEYLRGFVTSTSLNTLEIAEAIKLVKCPEIKTARKLIINGEPARLLRLKNVRVHVKGGFYSWQQAKELIEKWRSSSYEGGRHYSVAIRKQKDVIGLMEEIERLPTARETKIEDKRHTSSKCITLPMGGFKKLNVYYLIIENEKRAADTSYEIHFEIDDGDYATPVYNGVFGPFN